MSAGVARLRRRTFVALAVATPWLFGDIALARAGDPRYRLAFIQAFADTVLPADDFSPSASALGAHQRVAERTRTDARYADIVDRAAADLDADALRYLRRPFIELGGKHRTVLVGRIAKRPLTELTGWFFHATRAELFMAYYANPRSWAGLGIERPPQPIGYPDATALPAVTARG